MKDNLIPESVRQIYEKFNHAGYKLYLVGGSVRNMLLAKNIKDWDLTTNATPDDMLRLFSNAFYDNNFGTVGIPVKDGDTDHVVEVTTFRSDGEYKDNRRPETVSWGKTIEEDLTRRDFTINAIALELNGKESILNPNNLIDLHNGKQDLDNNLIRAVGDADSRLKEDALRMLRAVRFAAELNFIIEADTFAAIENNNKLILNISGERIRDELLKIMSSERAYEGIALLNETGILDLILPELTLGKGVSQVRPGRHHKSDVFTHNIESLKHTPSTNPIVKLATLLHDVGKPYVRSEDESGHVIFYNHEIKGAQIAYEIADRLRLSKKEREKIVKLIRWHMFTVDENITDAAIRRFIRRVGLENVSDMMDLRIGDRLGGGTQVAESWRLKKFKERVAAELNPPFSVNDLAIDGNDIMQELKLKPGPKIGEVLQKLFEEVDEDLSKNTRDYLLTRIKELK